MAVTNANLIEKVPVNIVKGANLEIIMNDLFNGFEAGEQRNAGLVNRFFNQSYFRGEESLIDKLVEVRPDIKFDDIKNEGINLALLTSSDWLWEFNDCLNKITNDEIKKAFIQEIFDKVQSEIGTGAPYTDFATECSIPGNNDVVSYFHKVVDYLNGKEGASHGKKSIDVLRKISISNDNLNTRLSTNQIPSGVELTNPGVPANTKDDFDKLLSFEIGKEADRTVEISKEISRKLEGLFSNTFPTINTIISENDKFKYDESKLGSEYQGKAEAINNNTDLDENEKGKQLNDLKREYYLKYVKSKNAKIGNALEQLYNNNFDYSKLEDDVLKNYIDTVVDTRLKMLFDNGINEVIKLNWGNLDEFKVFCKDLADPTKTSIDLSDVNLITGGTGTINIPVQKHKVEGENPRLKDIDQFLGREKSYDALPIRYEINKSDIDGLDLTIEDKTKLLNFLSRFNKGDKYVIEGKDVGMLIYLFFVINSRSPLTTFKSDDQEKIQNLFGEAKNREEDGEGEDGEKNSSENNAENNGENNSQNNSEDPIKEDNEGTEGFTPEKFKVEIERKGPGKFENGSEVWLPMGDSELPGGGHQWMKIKINNINMKKGTFKGKIFGGELKFSSKYEGKTKEFKMDKSFFDGLEGIVSGTTAGGDKIWLLPNPDKSDFNTFRNKLNGRLGTADFSFPPAGTTWDGGKFIQKITDKNGKEKEVEVKHFGVSSDDKLTYKVEYNPIKRSFTVSSEFNGDEKGKDGKSEKKRFSYKRDMDWNNFLIFFTQKGLVPQTEKQAKDAIQKQDKEFKMVNGGKWKLHRFSFNNIKHGLKEIFGALKKKIDDYNKKKDEEFKKSVENPILNALAAFPLLPPSIKSAIGERQQEIYNEEFNGAWTEIEKYLKALQSDGQFADTFDQVPPHVQTLYGKSYQEFIINLYNKRNTTTEEKRKAAALLLANFEKGGSPFRGLSDYENKGLRVKVLLGEEHYQQFLRDKAACIRDRDLAEKSKNSGFDKKGLNEQLDTCEMDYIINNVRGAYPKLPGSYFPSHENRGVNGDKSTNYIPNPSKRLLSEQFANKLEDAKKGRFTKTSVEETYGKNKSINRFEIMEDEFSKMGSSRYKQGAGALRRILDLASDKSLKKRAKRHFLTYLLSGVLDVHCDPGLKKQVYGWAKPISFVPGMLVKEAGVAENVAMLLDDIEPKGDFSRNVTKYFHRNKQLEGGIDFKGLQEEIKNWLTDEKMDQLDDYFAKLPTKDFSGYAEPNKSILEKFKKSLIDEDVEEFDRGLLDNPEIVNNGLLTNINVVSDRLRIEDGEFKGNDSDDINNKKEFWKDITKQLNDLRKSSADNPKIVDFVLNKYFTRFGLNSSQERQNVYKRINTAYYYQKQVSKYGGLYIPGHNTKLKDKKTGKYVNVKVPIGKIENKDIDRVLLYGLEGNVRSRPPLSGKILPKDLRDALDAFQEFFESAFRKNTLTEIKDGAFKLNVGDARENDRFLLGGWDIYKKIARKDDYTSVVESDDAEYNGNFSDLKESEQKKIWRSILRDDDLYINPHMENIEKTLKRNRNVLDGIWRLTTSDNNEQLLNLQEALNA